MRRRLSLGLLACLGAPPLAACEADFAAQRQDLDGFRIAALGVSEGVATAALWSGEGLYHDVAPELSWWVDGEERGGGWEVAVTEGALVELEVRDPDGGLHLARLTAASTAGLPGLERARWTPGAALDLATRRAAETEPLAGALPPGDAARLRLTEPGGEALAGQRLRWMLAGGAGTVLELEEDAADFLAEEVVLEDGEVVERRELGAGSYALLALSLDGEGANRWVWVDVPVGEEEPLWRHEGRLLPGSVDTGSGLVAGTVVEAAGLAGVALEDLLAVEDLSEQEALSCAPSDTPFRLAWLAEGRCTRPEILGRRVVVTAW